MAESAYSIEVKSSWEVVEADGSLCFVCDCACFLGQYQLVLEVNGKIIERGETVVCSSCHDTLEPRQ